MSNLCYSIKNLSEAIQDVDVKNGIITGYFAAFDNIDSDNEIFLPGSFKKTIRERGLKGANRILHLRQHNTREPLGKPHVLKEDNKGLYFESRISKTSYGIDTLQLYQDGIYTEHSVGFRIIKEEREEDKPTKILEVQLWEGSTVTWGANDEATFVGFKEEAVIDKIDALTKALTNGNYMDDTFALLEIELNQMKSLLVKEPSDDDTPGQIAELFGVFNDNMRGFL